MGPFFWLVHALGIPLWAGERLWVGAILFMAGTGVLALCRTMGVHGPGRLVAALAFMLSPYFLPVSYTHLDVYKRQGQHLEVVLGAQPQPLGLEELVLGLELGQTLAQLDLDRLHGAPSLSLIHI